MSNLIYIMGKSSSGKDTIKSKIEKLLSCKVYVPYTTRPIREGEKDGRDYHFLTQEQFAHLEQLGKVMEKRVYRVKVPEGTALWTYATVDDEQWKSQGDFLTVGTLESYEQLKEYFKKEKDKNLIPVYIEIDEQERRNRYIKRESKEKQPNMEEIERRLQADNIDFEEEKLKQAGITKKQRFQNYDLQECVNKIKNYIDSEIEANKIIKDKDQLEDVER